MRRALATVLAAACGGGAPVERRVAAEPPVAVAATAPAPAVDLRRWFAGDLHMHVAPIDAVEGATLDATELAKLGDDRGLDFVILTPHLHPSTVADPARWRRWARQWRAMADAARAATEMTVIPGAEFTIHGFGHFGVAGAELDQVARRDWLTAARAAGAMVIVNHPFATPSHIPGVPISDRDLSFRPWTTGRGTAPPIDGVEVRNLPLGLADLVTGAEPSSEAQALTAADALARRERRTVAIVGGTDSHRAFMAATTWVLALDASATSIVAAVRRGATCVGGVEGGDLTATGDGDPPGRRARIGDSVRATARVELTWSGRGRVFRDGVDLGEHDGQFVDDRAAGLHTYRVAVGDTRCGFVYANLAP